MGEETVTTATGQSLDAQVQEAINSFIGWLDNYGELSQDHQDYYAWWYGRWAKRQYYRHPKAGILLVAPFVFCEAFFPRTRALFRTKTRLPISDAHYAMAFAYLYERTGDSRHRQRAVHYVEMLKESRCPGYPRYAWGYPFHWETVWGTFPRGTPMITGTPYCYDAFADVFAIDGNPEWRLVMESTVEHVVHDLHDTELSPGVCACSYTPMDRRQVINANSYRAQMLARASRDLGKPAYWEIGECNLRYVLQAQNPDGSWPYATDGLGNFIDNFHTCFVLKHLARIYEITQMPEAWQAIERGARYYREKLLDDSGLPVPFAKPPRLIVYRRELYDYAECINLALLLRERLPEWNDVLTRLVTDILARWRKPDGSFRSRELQYGWDNCPMHRWAQAQLFCALVKACDVI